MFITSFKHPVSSIVFYSENFNGKEMLLKVMVGTAAEKEIKNKGEILPSTPLLIKLCSLMHNYLNGKKVDFLDIPLKIDLLSPFKQKILTTAREIPYGKLCSYSELAQKCGYPLAVRAVASVMRQNSFPIIIPCHRVILKNGNYGRYCGHTKGKDVWLKKQLIEIEKNFF